MRTWAKYLGCLSAHSSLASFGDAKRNGKTDPHAQHHELTHFFFHARYPGGLCIDTGVTEDHASLINARAQRVIDALAHIPMDDTIGEGPHAVVRGHDVHTKRGGFDWIAASSRLPHNLGDLDTLPSATGVDLQREWSRWSCVVKAKHWHRGSRQRRRQVVNRLYHLSALEGFECVPDEGVDVGEAIDAEDSDGGDDGGGGSGSDDDSSGGPGGGARGGAKRRRVGSPGGSSDSSSSGSNDEGGGEEGGGKGSGGSFYGRPADHGALMRQWLCACLETGYFITIPEKVGSGYTLAPFQVLVTKSTVVKVKVFFFARR